MDILINGIRFNELLLVSTSRGYYKGKSVCAFFNI